MCHMACKLLAALPENYHPMFLSSYRYEMFISRKRVTVTDM